MCSMTKNNDDIYSMCAMVGANLTCSTETVLDGVHMVFCSNGVDFTQVGQLHTECVCAWGGLT